jgi:multiple sugar transport system permease protein
MNDNALLSRIWAWVFTCVALLLTLFPIYWIFCISIKSDADAFAMPPEWFFVPVLDNYVKLWNNDLFRGSFLNSLIVTSFSIVLSLVIAIPAAYALNRMELRGKKLIAVWLLLAYMLPEFLFLIPIFVLYQWVGLYDTHFGLALVYQVHVLPFSIWMLRSFFAEIPKALDECAAMEGCTPWQILWKIYLPIAKPGIFATAILNAIWVWNELIIALGLTFTKAQTVTVGVTSFRGYTSIDWGAMTASSIVALIPMLIFSLIAQKHIVKGLSLGAVKG